MKKGILVWLLLTLLLAVFCFSAAADELVLPSDVKEIREEAFMGDTSLDTVVLPEGITYIGDDAFSNSSLSKINIPFGIDELRDRVFMNCPNLTDVTLPESLRTLSFCAFHQCRALTQIQLPDSLKTIGVQAFDDCDSLERIVIPDGVTSIGDYAFFSCGSLREAWIPQSVTSLGSNVFLYCSDELTLMVEPDSIALQYAVDNGIPYTIVEDAWATPAEEFVFSDNGDGTCTVTGYHGERGKVIVPEKNEQGLTVTALSSDAFAESQTLLNITLPASLTSLSDHAFYHCEHLTSVQLRGPITNISYRAFAYCYELENITLPGSVTTIGESSFWECRSLQNIEIPENVTFIGISAFEQCRGLTEITIPANVSQIDNYAFSNCVNLKEITILSDEISISDTAFNNCGKDLILYVNEGSDGQAYASASMIPYRIIGVEQDPSWPSFEEKTYDVLVINFDPVFEAAGGKKWHELLSFWSDPHTLAAEFAADMHEVSHGYTTYRVVDWIEVDEMPSGVDGFVYDKDVYYQTLMDALAAADGTYWDYDGWEDHGFNFDYESCFEKYQVRERVNSGEIDEVWLFAGPVHGNTMYETRMCGNGAFWCNSPGLEMDCKRFVAYGFNFEREAAEMIHDAGHRMESIMNAVFGWPDYSKDYQDYTDWEKFSAYDQVSPGHAGIGLIHFAPNSTSDYDWDNKTSVNSYCDDWLNYPNLTGIQRTVDCAEWNADQRGFIKWWFSHLPHAAGTNLSNGKYNNWWIYFTLEF